MAQYFQFNITNQQTDDPVIYTDQVTHIDNKDSKFSQDPSDKSYENLTLSIDNISKAVLSTLPLTGKPTETNYHFKLSFRSGVLSEKTIEKGLIAAGDWTISQAIKGKFGAVRFYFLHTKAGQWKPDETLSFQLTDFTAVYSSRNASDRRTELVLVANNLKSVPKASKPIKEINTLDIRIKNFLINKQLPLSLFFADHNTVLNEESAVNELSLQVHFPKSLAKNGPGTDTIHFTENSRLSIAFDAAPDAAPTEATPWALSTVALLQNCRIQAGDKTRWKPFKDHSQGVPRPPTANPDDAGQAVWTFEPAQAFSLAAGASLNFTISALQTGLPAGYTNLYFRYQDVPGYGSGSFSVPILKSPLVRRKEKVGIGTNLPTEMLSIGTKDNPGTLALFGDKSFLQLGVGVQDNPDSAGIPKIGYSTNAPGLDIYGGGADGANRKIQFYSEGGARFVGPLRITESYPEADETKDSFFMLRVDGNVQINQNQYLDNEIVFNNASTEPLTLKVADASASIAGAYGRSLEIKAGSAFYPGRQAGMANNGGDLLLTAGSAFGNWKGQTKKGNVIIKSGGNVGTNNATEGDIIFYTQGSKNVATERMRIANNGDIKTTGSVDSIVKVVVINDQIIGGPTNNIPGVKKNWEKTIDYGVTFKEKPQVYAVLQGYSAFGGTSNFNPYNSTAGYGTPGGGIGFAWVKVKEFTKNQATVHGFVSEGGGVEKDNSLLFTLVAIGRV